MEGSSTVVCDGHNWNSSAPICLSKSFHPFTFWSLKGDALVWAVTRTFISSVSFSVSWDFKITNLPYLVVFDQTNNLQRRRPCSLLDPGSGRSVSERASHRKPTRSHQLRISRRLPTPNPRPVPGRHPPGLLVQRSDLSGDHSSGGVEHEGAGLLRDQQGDARAHDHWDRSQGSLWVLKIKAEFFFIKEHAFASVHLFFHAKSCSPLFWSIMPALLFSQV